MSSTENDSPEKGNAENISVLENSASSLCTIDRELILLTQKGLPTVPRPYHFLGVKLGITGEEVMRRLEAMLASGKIRRIAAVPNHYALGYCSNGMTVWDVPDDKVRELGQALGALSFVSHCYHRPRHLPLWTYNLFAMVHGKKKREVEHHIEEITKLLGEHCRASDVLYSTKILKKTGLRINRKNQKAEVQQRSQDKNSNKKGD